MKTLASPARLLPTRMLVGLMLAIALLPALSRAWAMAEGGDWVEICSAQGARWIQLEDADADAVRPMAEPCAFCLLQAQLLAPPPASPTRAPLAAPPALATPSAPAPRPLALWPGRRSRGPPRC